MVEFAIKSINTVIAEKFWPGSRAEQARMPNAVGSTSMSEKANDALPQVRES